MTSQDMKGNTMISDAQFTALKTEIAEWVAGPGEQWSQRIERRGAVPQELVDELRGHGWMSLAAPEELGGRGVGFERFLELMEYFSRLHASIRMLVHVNNGIWRALVDYVDDQQREQILIPTVKGDKRIAFTLTEADSGTGADIRTTLRREGDIYYMNGEKHLITFGMTCDYWLLTARLEGTTGHDGTVALLVPNTGLPGVELIDDSQTMGIAGTDHAIMHFHDVPVPVSARVGEEGQGLAVALGGFLLPSRISVAMSCVGLAERAQQLAVEYAKQRVTFGKPLAKRQAIQFLLARNHASILAARSLVLEAGRGYQAGRPDAGALSSAAKMTAVDMLAEVTDNALQVFGGRGYFKRETIERVYRDARAQRFEEGTNEIQSLIVARSVLDGTARYADDVPVA
ncbi:acyl-CoA dehydrogenase family protein [Acidipropionibacterium jensenii]|uniref:acyl-CoA dehydrogenase family protein n=1 Tax=Acidipropionibacterium jensenii TaxID=1749 RepID=UPI00214A9A35|nr:acyl-CoA dehydrogenase family protein [Acidipropionibacterium jensenii]